MKIEKRSEGRALRLRKKFHKDEEKAKEVGGGAVEVGGKARERGPRSPGDGCVGFSFTEPLR